MTCVRSLWRTDALEQRECVPVVAAGGGGAARARAGRGAGARGPAPASWPAPGSPRRERRAATAGTASPVPPAWVRRGVGDLEVAVDYRAVRLAPVARGPAGIDARLALARRVDVADVAVIHAAQLGRAVVVTGADRQAGCGDVAAEV